MEVIRFNTWDAFNRAVEYVENNYPDKQLHGQIYLPTHCTFKSWEEFYEAVKTIKEVGWAINATLPDEIPQSLRYPDSNKNCVLPSIYGEIWVEITDSWIRR